MADCDYEADNLRKQITFLTDLIKNAENQQHSMGCKPSSHDKFHFNKKYRRPGYNSSLTDPSILATQSASKYTWAPNNPNSKFIGKNLDRRQVKSSIVGELLPRKADTIINQFSTPISARNLPAPSQTPNQVVSHLKQLSTSKDNVTGNEEKSLQCASNKFNSDHTSVFVKGINKKQESAGGDKERHSEELKKIKAVSKPVQIIQRVVQKNTSPRIHKHVPTVFSQGVKPQSNTSTGLPTVRDGSVSYKEVSEVGLEKRGDTLRSVSSQSLKDEACLLTGRTVLPSNTHHVERTVSSSQCVYNKQQSNILVYKDKDNSLKDKKTLYDSALSFLSTALGETVSFKGGHMRKCCDILNKTIDHGSRASCETSNKTHWPVSSQRTQGPGTSIALFPDNSHDVCDMKEKLRKTENQIKELRQKISISDINGIDSSEQAVAYNSKESKLVSSKEKSFVENAGVSPKFKSLSPYKYVRESSDVDSVFEHESSESRYSSPQTQRKLFPKSRHNLQRRLSQLSDSKSKDLRAGNDTVNEYKTVVKSRYVLRKEMNTASNKQVFPKNINRKEYVIFSKEYNKRNGNKGRKSWKSRYVFVRNKSENMNNRFSNYKLTRFHSLPSNPTRKPVSREQLKWNSKQQYSSKNLKSADSPKEKDKIVKSKYKLQRVSVGNES
ncbi:hypothetical protein ScPMuIL_001801 [Solemya velum]